MAQDLGLGFIFKELIQGLGSRRNRCRVNAAHIRQPSPDSGFGFQVKVLKTFELDASSIGSSSSKALRLKHTASNR